jgi:hypothetical protein
MINRIFNLHSPPNDPSSSEYSQKTTLELRNSNFSPPRWLFNPATTAGKNCAFNLHFAKSHQNPQSEPNAATIPPKKSSRSDLPTPLPAAPEHLVASESEMAPKKSEIEGKKKEAQPSIAEWTHSKCSLNDLNKLVSEGLLQEKNLVNWRPSYREPFPMENVDEIVTFLHFAERGLAPPPLVLSSGAFCITTGLSFITSTRILSATFQFLSVSTKLSLESNPTRIFSASSSASNHNPHQRTFSLRGAPAFNCHSRPATNISHTNSPPTFPGGRIIGFISRTMLPTSQRNQTDRL